MIVGATGEIVIYVLGAAQAVSVGLIFGLAPASKHRIALYLAGLLMVGVTVVAGFAVGTSAPWLGPIFALIAAATGVGTAAWSLGNDPAMQGESFGQRIVYALARRPAHIDVDEGAR